jgi:septal ring factor EnvC (AmiA/AmiB activator)
MSEMSLEILIQNVSATFNYKEYKDEILSRFAELQAKVKELELENEVLREQNFAMNKNAIKNKRQIANLQQQLDNSKSDGRRAIEAMEKLLKIRKDFRTGESVAYYIGESGEILDDYEQANSKADFFHSTEVGTSHNQGKAKEPK